MTNGYMDEHDYEDILKQINFMLDTIIHMLKRLIELERR